MPTVRRRQHRPHRARRRQNTNRPRHRRRNRANNSSRSRSRKKRARATTTAVVVTMILLHPATWTPASNQQTTTPSSEGKSPAAMKRQHRGAASVSRRATTLTPWTRTTRRPVPAARAATPWRAPPRQGHSPTATATMKMATATPRSPRRSCCAGSCARPPRSSPRRWSTRRRAPRAAAKRRPRRSSSPSAWLTSGTRRAPNAVPSSWSATARTAR
mmetsp:Transcript_30590/g.94502  ORF Transcript_30590/g.94502 Transcript_30590/m.94502 type:complete len:216 (+) Transcript_30590:322-969(+)